MYECVLNKLIEPQCLLTKFKFTYLHIRLVRSSVYINKPSEIMLPQLRTPIYPAGDVLFRSVSFRVSHSMLYDTKTHLRKT